MTDATPPPELGSRALFPRLKARAYLSHAAISPPSLLVERAVARALDDYAEQGVGAFPHWIEQRHGLRERIGRLVGAPHTDIALTPGTTHSISHLALSLPWRRGDRVVLFRGEFPANITPWQQAAALFDLEPVWLPLPTTGDATSTDDPAAFVLEQLDGALRSGARLVAVSAVQFQTGLRMPLAAMGRLCRTYGAELAVDAIQACGATPVDVARDNIDYLACGAHKWLLGVEGAGFLFVRPELVGALAPRTAGWLSHVDAESFLMQGPGHLQYDRPFKPSAALFEGSSSNVLGFAALDASIGALLELGVDAIFHHVQTYLDQLEAALVDLGYRSLRARTAACRSCILSVAVPPGVDGARIVAQLRAEGIAISYPDGFLRFAPHFSNSLEEIPIVVDAARRALSSS